MHPASAFSPAFQGHVLAVEDDPTTLTILTALLEDMNFEVTEARNGKEALEILKKVPKHPDVIVLDKQMPEMGGLEVVRYLKSKPEFMHIPVVMVTGSTRPEEIREGIDAGVFHYLAKPYEEEVFRSVMMAAMLVAGSPLPLATEVSRLKTGIGLMIQAEFRIKNLEEAEILASLIACSFPDPGRSRPGLHNLLFNAIEHGSLEIGRELKQELLRDGTLEQEINRRESLPEYNQKVVTVHLFRNENETKVVIKDEGKGFRWSEFLKKDPSGISDGYCGGIALARELCFDSLAYSEHGNEVTAISYNHTEGE